MKSNSLSIRKPPAKKKRKKKGKVAQLLEYGAVCALLPMISFLPLRFLHGLSRFLGSLFYLFKGKRRRMAIENIRQALGSEKSQEEIERIAHKSCQSFVLTCLEIAKFQHVLRTRCAREILRDPSGELERLLEKAKKIHEVSGGCIFVTPHIGNWEFLPHVCSIIGIPLVVVVRPLDNVYLERLIYGVRADSGHAVISKRNALFMLPKAIRQGKSIGILPDQSTRQGIRVNFFGRKAWTTPAPAILSILYRRPIVVVACCRSKNGYDFEAVVSDPLWPGTYESEREEIFRLTEEMNKRMEEIIRRYPEQYLWVHDRWKTYRHSKERFR